MQKFCQVLCTSANSTLQCSTSPKGTQFKQTKTHQGFTGGKVALSFKSGRGGRGSLYAYFRQTSSPLQLERLDKVFGEILVFSDLVIAKLNTYQLNTADLAVKTATVERHYSFGARDVAVLNGNK